MLIPCSISYQHSTDLSKYIGAFEISGSTWRVYHDAGHTDLNATSGALTHRYYVRDYLGSTRAVIDESGNVLQSTAYYPLGGRIGNEKLRVSLASTTNKYQKCVNPNNTLLFYT